MTPSIYEGASEMGSCYDIGEPLESNGKMKNDSSFEEIALDVPPQPTNSLCSPVSPDPKLGNFFKHTTRPLEILFCHTKIKQFL